MIQMEYLRQLDVCPDHYSKEETIEKQEMEEDFFVAFNDFTAHFS